MTINDAEEAKKLHEQITTGCSGNVVNEILGLLETKIKMGGKSINYILSKDARPFKNVIMKTLQDKGFTVEYSEGYADFREDIPDSITVSFE